MPQKIVKKIEKEVKLIIKRLFKNKKISIKRLKLMFAKVEIDLAGVLLKILEVLIYFEDLKN